ncbi:MAG: amino acid-binding protein [Candidatus Methanomethylophilaceae archaeon]|nr:amino acid-binding protein [Candidatus Methanomethylophilaceae archaeon]
MMSNIIKQLSIFVNNEPGRLAYISSVLKECNINMRAFNLAESTEFGILRTIVDNPDEAYDKLKVKGIIVKKTDVIGVYMQDTPGALFQAADALGKASINIEYGYAYSYNDKAIFFIRVDDPEKAVDVISKQGIKLVAESEI